jgi:electron transfer flavoprotein beta subunit
VDRLPELGEVAVLSVQQRRDAGRSEKVARKLRLDGVGSGEQSHESVGGPAHLARAYTRRGALPISALAGTLSAPRMKIAALIKRVPTTEAQAKVGADGKSLDSSGFQYMPSFYDEIAVEAAIQTKEKLGGDVTVLTLGPQDAAKELREFIARGADAGAILVDPAWHARDARSTAKALAKKIGALGAELVLAGRVATDRDNAAVGPMLATYLGWACVTEVVSLEIAAGKGVAKRETEHGVETVEFPLPAVVTCNKGLNEPRRPNLKGIMAAKSKPIAEEPAEAIENQAVVEKVELPPSRKAGRIVGEGAAAVPELVRALREEAHVL